MDQTEREGKEDQGPRHLRGNDNTALERNSNEALSQLVRMAISKVSMNTKCW